LKRKKKMMMRMTWIKSVGLQKIQVGRIFSFFY
jgi:hypothetical protein